MPLFLSFLVFKFVILSHIFIFAIKDFTFCEITLAALQQFCVHHQITVYKNKTKEMTGALIIQYARTKSITDALYPCSKEDGKDEDVTYASFSFLSCF